MADTREFKGETINKEFIERLEKVVKQEWKVSKDSASKDTTHPTDFKDNNGDAILIAADKKEEYELLVELLEILKFDLTAEDEIYRMPLGEIPVDMKEFEIASTANKTYKKEDFSFNITKKGANQLYQKHKEYEKMLGIEFPQELFQLVKPTVNIPTPETNFPAPEPRKYSEDAQAYETRMFEYYQAHHYEPQMSDAGRPPLPHEWVTYSDEIPKINPTTPIARRSYKAHLEELHLTPDMSTANAPKGLKDGERKRIKSTRLGHHLLTTTKFGRKEIKGKNVLKGLVGIGLGTFGLVKIGSLFGAGKIPAIVLGQAALKLLIPIVIVLLAYFLYKNYGKRFFRAVKNKLKDLIKGKRLSEDDLEHDGDHDGDVEGGDDGDSDGEEGPGNEEEPEEELGDNLDAEGFFEEFQEGYKHYVELEGKKKIIEGELAELQKDPVANKALIEAKMQEKTDIIALQKEWCRNMYKTMAPYAQAAHLDPENPGRGMGK